MSITEIIGLWLALLVMTVGLMGCLIPGIPSTPIILLGAVGHKIYFQEDGSSWWMIGLLLLITIFSLVLEHLAAVVGAKKLGATRKGIIGAFIGVMVGFFFSLPGMILGPFIGAVSFELIGGREWRDASKAGVGAIVGLLAGTLGKIACSIAMIAAFAGELLWRDIGFN